MHQQGLNGVAGGGVLALAVHRHPNGFVDVGRRIHVEVAHPIGMAQHRNAGVVLDEAHQFVASPGNDQVHEAIETQQGQAFLTGGEQSQGIGRHRTGRQACLQGIHHSLIGAASLTAPFQQSTVARTDRQRGDLHHRIRPGFKDHTHHPERNGDPFQHQALIQLPMQLTTTQRVTEAGHLADAINGRRQLGVIQLQPRHQSRRQPLGCRALEVFTVGREDAFRTVGQRVRHRLKRLSSLAVIGLPQINSSTADSRGTLQQRSRRLWNAGHQGNQSGAIIPFSRCRASRAAPRRPAPFPRQAASIRNPSLETA